MSMYYSEKELINALVETSLNNVVSEYLPIEEDKASYIKALEDVIISLKEDLIDNNCFGLYGYYKDGEQVLYYNNGISINSSNINDAVKYYTDIVLKIISFDIIKKIDDNLREKNNVTCYSIDLPPRIIIKNEDISFKVDYKENSTIPIYRKYYSNGKGNLDKLVLCNFTSKENYTISEKYNDIVEQCVRFNLWQISIKEKCAREYDLHNFNLVVDHTYYPASKLIHTYWFIPENAPFIKERTSAFIKNEHNKFLDEKINKFI